MVTTGPVAGDDVQARYTTPRRRWTRVVWAVVGGVVAVVAFASVTASVVGTDVRWRDVGFEVVDDEHVRVTFEVYAEAGTQVRCQVRAASSAYGDLGQVDVDLGPLPAGGDRATVEVRTLAPAVSASVRTCVLRP